MHSIKPTLTLTIFILLGLVACAPAPSARVSVTQPLTPPTYYPHSPGARWHYLPQGEVLDAPALVQQVNGPTLIDGAQLVAWRTTGRGLELSTYRVYREDGVYIPREAGPGYVTTISPPIREWPRPGTLHLGATWSGEAVATVSFTEEQAADEVRFAYRYEVVDERTVATAAGTHKVFVVAFESRSYGPAGEARETLRQEVWFAPFVGEVRTDNGLFLVETNLPLRTAKPAPAAGTGGASGTSPSLEAQNAQLVEQLSQLDGRLLDLQGDLQIVEGRRRGLERKLATMRAQVGDAQARHQSLSQQLVVAAKAKRTLLLNAARLRTQMWALSEQLTEVESARTASRQGAKQTLAVALAELNQARRRLSETRTWLANAQQASTELTRQLDDVAVRRSGLRIRLEAVTAEQELLMAQLVSVTGSSRALLLGPHAVQLEHAQRRAAAATYRLRDFLFASPSLSLLDEAQQRQLNTLRREVMQAQINVFRLLKAEGIHTVRSGDVLSGIARELYGRSGRWPEIVRANTFLTDSDELFAGMMLVIP